MSYSEGHPLSTGSTFQQQQQLQNGSYEEFVANLGLGLAPNPASMTVQIPLAHLKDTLLNLSQETKQIGVKTNTRIDSYELHQFAKVRFCILGKWRDCCWAGRLLWYSLTKEFTVYMNSSWDQLIEAPLEDQKGKSLKQVYGRVKFSVLKDFKLMQVTGPCWDVLKFRKEVIRRKRKPGEAGFGFEYGSNAAETTALRVLKLLKGDVHEDGVQVSDSLYYIKNSQLLELLIGGKEREKEKEKDGQVLPKVTITITKPASSQFTNSLLKTRNLALEVKKLEEIEFPESPEQSFLQEGEEVEVVGEENSRAVSPSSNSSQSSDTSDESAVQSDVSSVSTSASVGHRQEQVAEEMAFSQVKDHAQALLSLLEDISLLNLTFEMKMLLRRLHVQTDVDAFSLILSSSNSSLG